MNGKVVIAGGTGWIGGALAAELRAAGAEVYVLTREPGGEFELEWDARTPGPWAEHLEDALAVVNLVGAPITMKWTKENRKEILESRTRSTEAIGLALTKTRRPPGVWINGSATGIYGHREDEILTEVSEPGDGFLADVCLAWEGAFEAFAVPGVRRVRIRTGVVLGPDGGALDKWELLAKLFLGGAQGKGEQWVPWIHLDDLVGLFMWAIEGEAEGVYNGVAPEPVRNRELMRLIRQALHRPWAPPAPRWALGLVGKLGGPDPDILLDSVRARPERAIMEGFRFDYPFLRMALSDLFHYEGEWGADDEEVDS